MIERILGVVAAMSLLPTAASGKVLQAGASGFAVETTLEIAASPAKVYAAMIQPRLWWNKAHSWTGDAANLSLDARAGGCFCERSGEKSFEHARVIAAVPGKLLRMSGALGPLQAEGVEGTLSWSLSPTASGTRLIARYVVGGYASFDLAAVAPAVDGVMAEQMGGLKQMVERDAAH